MSKCISVLGSTGSIGRQTLQVAEELGLRVAALTAGRQIDLLEQQARQFRPCLAAVYEEAAARELRERLKDLPIQVMSGMEGLLAAAELAESDTVVTAVMGSVGLEPTLAAIRKKKRIALANKETLVCAGELVMAEAKNTARRSCRWTRSIRLYFRAFRAAGTEAKLSACCSPAPEGRFSARALGSWSI